MDNEAPEPHIDEDPDEGDAAGGVDAIEPAHQADPVTPDAPMSPQVDENAVPDAIQEGEEPDQSDEGPVSGEGETPSEPSA